MRNINNTFGIKLKAYELSELIGRVYQAALMNEWSSLLDKIITVTNSNKAFIVLNNTSKKKPLVFKFQTNFSVSKELLEEYYARFEEDPFYGVTKAVIEGESLNISDYLQHSEIEKSDFYKKIFVPLRSYHCLASILIRDEYYDATFAINRDKSDKKYDKKDLNLIRILTPHLSKALNISKTLQLYKDYSSISKSILDQIDKAFVICDENGRIILCNGYANEVLNGNSPIYLNVDKLKIKQKIYNEMLYQLIKQCAHETFINIVAHESIILESEGKCILISVSPLTLNNSQHKDLCLITITFQENLHWKNVKQDFHLTPKELHLLQGLHNKRKLNELTKDFGVTYNTLRTHLQSIFKKLDVNSQAELMLKLNLYRS